MTVEGYFGFVAMALGLAMVFLGFPAQILKNAKEGRSGQPLLMIVLPGAVFISRVLYALEVGATWIVVPDALGALMCAVLLWQWFRYRSR